MTKVLVSGCFDVLHSGHIAFLEEAAEYGDLYVSLGSDQTIEKLKLRKPLYNEQERLYMLKSVRFVKDAFIAKGKGILDFAEILKQIKPDIFFVNSDGDSLEKRNFIEGQGISYIVSQRLPKEYEKGSTLPVRSTTKIREILSNEK